jgi:hypothetical protein
MINSNIYSGTFSEKGVVQGNIMSLIITKKQPEIMGQGTHG